MKEIDYPVKCSLTHSFTALWSSSEDAGENVDVVHPDIDPDEPSNMRFFLAFEWTQAAPQSFFLNDFAF